MASVQEGLGRVQQLAQAGRFEEAERVCRGVASEHPESAPARSMLGQLLLKRGAAAEAREHLEAAAGLEPGVWQHQANLGQCLVQAGATEAGRAAMQRAVDLAPGSWQARLAQGFLLGALRDGGAREALLAAIDAAGTDRRVLLQMAGAMRGQNQAWAAAKAMERLADLSPGDVRVLVDWAATLFQAREFERAEEIARRATDVTPQFAPAWSMLARVCERVNKLDEALLAAERAVQLDPSSATAAIDLANVEQRLGKLPEARDRMLRLLGRGGVPDDARSTIHLQLGQTLDTLGESAEAMRHILEGKRLWRMQPRVARHSMEIFPKRLAAYAAVDWEKEASKWGRRREEREAPIFFVGFPRSGTTLLETMLSSHRRIVATDEQPILVETINTVRRRMPQGREFPDHLCTLGEDELAEMERTYWSFAERDIGAERLAGKRLLDKMPLNICYLPVVRRVFPGAKVLVALRDPRDVCISCLFQPFGPNDAMVHFTTMESTVALYRRVMELWLTYRRTLGLEWMESRYEDLVAEPEARIRAILEFLGEEWDENVLKFAERKRSVRTPSYRGVAQGVHSRSVKRWEKHRETIGPHLAMLAPVLEALGYAE